MSGITRRDFTKAAVLTGAGMAAAGVASTVAAALNPGAGPTSVPASERIRVGIIGVGNRGDRVLDSFLTQKDVEVVAVSDVYQPYLDFAMKKIGTGPAKYTDYRQLLDRKDVDAVVVATPDHWHALQTIHACQAGKDVYVEKPLSLTVAEGRAMVNAARRYNRVTQVGIQRRSWPVCRQMVELIRGGGIGKISSVRAFHIQNEWPHGIGRPADEAAPPKDLDWDKFLGPAPAHAYNKNRSLYRFRWFYDYSGGQVTNTGTHYLDMIQWALGEDAPRSVVAMGGKPVDFDDREIPDTLEAMWTYPSGVLVTFSQFNASSAEAAARPCEIEFRGTKGTLYFNNGAFEVVPETPAAREYPILSPIDRGNVKGWRDGKPEIEPKTVALKSPAEGPHVRNFLDCVKSRAKCNADIETGHRSTSATLIANIALKTRALLDWDAKTERFTNHEAANTLLNCEYRKPYELPKIG